MKILCNNIRTYPSQSDIHGTSITVVLVDGGPFYAAYAGHGSQLWVAAHGNKLSFAEAKIHFPAGLKEELYRE